MLNKLAASLRKHHMIAPGEEIICAVSGGADSVALLFAMKLLTDVWDFKLSAAHFNHHLRGAESDRDEAFVRDFCARFQIPLYVGGAHITPGKKGLEASARDARYAFFRTLPGKIATAHTADDNAETILMHLLRGTGLKGLGGITPKTDCIIRPMLDITREDVEHFLEEYALPHIEDSSNESDDFLRNRIRHRVMPLLTAENPRFARNITVMAQNLRTDENYLSSALLPEMPGVYELRTLHRALRLRYLERFLKQNGVPEPEVSHLEAMEALLFNDSPSARGQFPGGVTIARQYDRLVRITAAQPIPEIPLPKQGSITVGDYRITVSHGSDKLTYSEFSVIPNGQMVVRSRKSGDEIRLHGGTKSLKKLFVDRKIPASCRPQIPVIADSLGVLAVAGIGANLDRVGNGEEAVTIALSENIPKK